MVILLRLMWKMLQDVYQKLLQEGVIVRPLNAYEMPKHIRITIGTGEQNERFLAALQKILLI